MTHTHVGGKTGCVEIDEHVCLSPLGRSLAPKGVVLNTPEADAYGTELVGFMFGHDREGLDHRCEGAVMVKRREGETGPVWQMSGSLEGGDLTLSPSILCVLGNQSQSVDDRCGYHGFVQDGKWVPA